MWDGSDPRGRTIFVHTEQGFGDTIQFARYGADAGRARCDSLVRIATSIAFANAEYQRRIAHYHRRHQAAGF